MVYTPDLRALLLERADHPGYWQSVTGSQDEGETLMQTAEREILEETGFDSGAFGLTDWSTRFCFEIFPEWRHRYAPEITHNDEHVFGLSVPEALPVQLNPREHVRFIWLSYEEAAEKVFSWTNAAAIKRLPQFAPRPYKAV